MMLTKHTYFWLKSLLVLILVRIGNCIAVSSTQQQNVKIVEANHFYSNYEINATYDITQVDPSKPIIYFLKKKEQNSIFDNNITITLISGDKQSQCLFTNFDKMCFLNNLPTPQMQLKIKCDHLPCQASWTLLQPAMKKVQHQQAISDLFDISQSNQHMIAMVTCNNPAVQNFNQKIQAYSQNDYVRGYTNNIIYFLFTKQKQGHIYFIVDDEAKSCAQMAVYNVKKQMSEGDKIKDFVLPTNISEFVFSTRPTQQFRFDCSIHELNKQPISSDLHIEILGDKNGNTQKIHTSIIKPGFATTIYDFNYAIPAISPQYQNIRIQMKSTNKIIMINFELHSGVVEVEETQHSHFSLRAYQSLKYQIVPTDQAPQSDKLRIFTENQKVTLSTSQCFKRQGCQFNITSPINIQSSLYIGRKQKSESTRKELAYIEFSQKITHKINQDDTLYFKRKIAKNEVFQLVVNNPNVIIYASSQAKCQNPSQQCYQKIANIHSPFIYESKVDGFLLLAVNGLDNCQFTITTISEGDQAIVLHDNQPFAYLMDDHQFNLEFKFKNPQKSPVSFNLISPLSSLILVVGQGKQTPNPDEDQVSLDGFVSISQDQIKSKEFRVLVQKSQSAKKQFIHFTLIASLAGSNLRLDPGVVHYETLKNKEHRDFVFEFDTKQDYLINFYSYNLQKEDEIKLPLMISNEDKWTDKKVQHFQIDSASDVLNLKDVSADLCLQQGTTKCEIFVRIVNAMDIQVDLQVTLLVKDSVIQLKDGMWQTYAINTIAKSSHFFFQPKSQNKSVSIIYKSSLVDLGVAYAIWKSDEKNMNPGQWPFPVYKEEVVTKMDQINSVNHILVDHSNLKGCWPSCIILVSLYKKKSTTNSLASNLDPSFQGNFSIMVSNQIIELPQKTKIDIYLKESQQKFIMLDLKYAMDKEALTFFTSTILGYYILTANAYSQKNQRCPEQYESDFSFGQIETQLKISTIQAKLQELEMQDDQNLYLCMRAQGIVETKFSVEFTTQQQIIKVLKYDSFQHIKLDPNVPKYFQLEAWQKYEIKFTRESGFFFVKLSVCDNKKDLDYQDCLDELKQDSDRGKQIISKTEQFSEQPCPKCIVFVRLQAEDPAQVIIHIQSKYSTIQLKQKDVISDFTNQGEQNKYSIISVQDQETVINVEVSQGEPVVSVTDYGDLNIQKQKNQKTNNIHIVIPPIQQSVRKTGQLTPLGGVNYNAFGYSSTFRFLTVKVKSKNSKMPTAYTISYSSGERETYLEDGLLMGYTLQANKLSKFLYKNPQGVQHGYITISMNKSSTLYNLKLKMYTMTDPYDEDTKVEVTPQKPPMRKKSVNPTITYSLPVAKQTSIEMQSEEQAKVTIMVNHKQVILLPFDTQFPFQLHKNESLNLITDVNNPGYILLTLRKCDDSEPVFGYTFDYNSYQKSQFEYTTTMEGDPRFQFYIKASKIGTLYMQMNSTDDNGLFSMKAVYSPTKITTGKMKPGNNGIIEYQVVNSQSAIITISGVVCASGKCGSPVKYYWAADKSMQDVYTQTVCPYSYFQTAGVISVPPIKFNELANPNKNNENSISFDYPLLDHVSYLSIKAVSSDGSEQVFYKPVEILTLWGSINKKTSWTSKMGVGIVALVAFCLCLVCYRRWKKSTHYDRLPEEVNDYY